LGAWIFRSFNGYRGRREVDKALDQWIRLMGQSDKISAGDPSSFELVKKHLENRIARLRKANVATKPQ